MRPLVLTLALSMISTSAAHADLLLDLQYSDMTTSRTVFSGDTIELELILRDPSDDTFISAEGLGSGGGVLVDVVGGGIPLAPAGPVGTGPGFDPLATSPGAPAARPGLIDQTGKIRRACGQQQECQTAPSGSGL